MIKIDRSELLSSMLNDSHDMIFIISVDDGKIEYVNQTVIDNFGYTLDEMNAMGIDAFRIPKNHSDTFSKYIQDLKEKSYATEYTSILRKNGKQFPIEAKAKLIHRNGLDYIFSILRDITEHVEAKEKLENTNKNLESLLLAKTDKLQKNVAFLKSYKRAMDESSIVSKSDLDGSITYVNDKFCEVTGYTKEEVIGRPHSLVRHPDTSPEVFRELWRELRAKRTWHGVLKNRKKDGSYYWVDINILPIFDERGEVLEYMAIRHDITELVDQREVIEKIATTDTLTNLGNRYKLIQDIESSETPSIALLDIERFSEINDLYGDSFGDVLIQEVGATIEKLLQDKEIKKLYRLQADVFAILNISLSQTDFIENINEMIKKIESLTYEVDGEEVMVQLASSISFEKDDLFITADMALKSAKKRKTSLIIYNEELNLDALYENNIKWTNKLRNAIKSDNLVPYYQAIVNNKTGKWEKYESLVRMIDEDGKIISPFFFLEIAQRTKYYETLTKTVIKKSFDTFKDSDKEISINLTIKDIINPNIQHYLCDMLESYNLDNRLVFEIVESEGIENFDEVIEFIDKVKTHNCKIAIDDFGTGYSNFNYLLKLRADYIKIDGSLIKHLDTDKNAMILVKNIVGFAQELGMMTIAEYVENSTIYEIVKELGIDYSQGYFFSEPLEAPLFER